MNFSQMLAIGLAVTLCAGTAGAATLIDNSTPGYYNENIGRSLNGTNPYGGSFSLFPLKETGLDAVFGPGDLPDLSSAAAVLGNWLSDPANPGGSWSDETVAIPRSWARHAETAIIYTIDGGLNGLTNVMGSFGLDNGLFVWLNGTFLGGFVQQGDAQAGEWTLSLGDLAAGTHYLQLLREDHGITNDYIVSVTGDPAMIGPTVVIDPAPVPLPASAPLLIAGIGGLVAFRRRKAG